MNAAGNAGLNASLKLLVTPIFTIAQDFVGRTLSQVAHQCSFVEPFLGRGGGFVQVTRATGVGPVLLLLPLAGTEFEAWRPLRDGEDLMRLDFMCEMSHELPLTCSF